MRVFEGGRQFGRVPPLSQLIAPFGLLTIVVSCGRIQEGGATWKRTLGGSGEDWAYSVEPLHNGGFVVAGYTESDDGDVVGNHGGRDAWVMRLDETGAIEWQQCFGGTGNDEARKVLVGDEGFYLVGQTDSNDGDVKGWHTTVEDDGHIKSDLWIIKISGEGALEWQVCLGGSKGDWSNDAIVSQDGGIVVAAYAWSNDGDVVGRHGIEYGDAWVVKLNRRGEIEWQRCIGGSGVDVLYSVTETVDQGYVLTGYTNSKDGDITDRKGWPSDAWVVKLSTSGTLLWQVCLGDDAFESQASVVETTGNILVVAIGGEDGEPRRTLIYRMSNDGVVLEKKQVGYGRGDDGFKIVQGHDGDFAVCGSSWSAGDGGMENHGESDLWLIGFHAEFAVKWQHTYGGSDTDMATSIRSVGDGFIVVGTTASVDSDLLGKRGNDSDVWLLKTDETGSVFTSTAP